MKTISIINHVLGPVMRGPSSFHTAGAFHIGCMASSLLGGMPSKAMLAFDPAGSVFQAEAAGELSLRSVHIRAAARAMAVMHVDGAMGVVCAAPTGGSAGVIPGTFITLAEERSLTREQIALALLAAGAVGVAMPPELRCTSHGGLAVTPSALALQPGCRGSDCSSCR